MQLENLKSLTQGIPSKWKPKYILKRIGDEDISISLETRNEVLKQLANNGRFVQIGEYTIMLNAIKSIDPMFGAKNIPSRPKAEYTYEPSDSGDLNTMTRIITNQEEIDEWDELFGKGGDL